LRILESFVIDWWQQRISAWLPKRLRLHSRAKRHSSAACIGKSSSQFKGPLTALANLASPGRQAAALGTA